MQPNVILNCNNGHNDNNDNDDDDIEDDIANLNYLF